MNRDLKRWGLIIFLAAAALRVGWVAWSWHQTGATLSYPDEELHWQLARNLVEKGSLVTDDGRYAARMPLYPLFLTPFALSVDHGIIFARIAQTLISAATVLLIYRFVRTQFGKPPALLAAGLATLDPFSIFFTNLLLTESVFILFGVALTVCAWPHLRDPQTTRIRTTIGVGVFGAAAILTRPSAAGWIGLLWIILWLYDRDRRRATLRTALYACTLVIGLLPWGIRNQRLLGAYAWLSANGGVTLYDAQGPQADGGSNQQFVKDLAALAELNEIERDTKLRDLAWQQMRENRARVIKLAWTKFRRMWNLVPNVAEYRAGAAALASAVFTAGVLVLTLTALCRFYRQRQKMVRQNQRLYLLLFLPVLYFTLLHCVFIGSVRYRVPLMPFLEIAAGTLLIASSTASRDSSIADS